MTTMIFKLLGGIGLFLMGIVLLTEGLKAFAGQALRRALVRFTGTPWKAFVSGVVVTAMVQSSSATTVTVIGFVSAGLLTFPQAVGVVFGASLGTTGTGWMISVLGLKVSIGLYALPLVGIGALLRLLAVGRWKALGSALAGFGLIFLGIDTLQTGMQGMSSVFNLAKLPASGLVGHLLTMLIGVVLTVVMQSSSAAVAMTLTALHAQAVNFDQASSLVIGAAIGTTVTGALAAIGGTVSAKRTALAHVLFNLATGLIAVVLLPVFLWGIGLAQQHLGLDPGATSLAAFHTLFIAVGVAIFLPLVHPFARWIERLLPEHGPTLTRHLDNTLLSLPAVALEATRRALSEIAGELFRSLRDVITGVLPAGAELRRAQIQPALERTQEFFAKVPPVNADEPILQSRVAQVHAIDHLVRLQNHWEMPPGLPALLGHERVLPAVTLTRHILELAEAGLRGTAPADWLTEIQQASRSLAELRRDERALVLRQTAGGDWGPNRALELLDVMRWLDRLGYHTVRACLYLADPDQPKREEQPDEDPLPA